MTRRRLRVQADGYGVHLELLIDHADVVTRQELDRALDLLAAEAKHAHEEAR